MDTHKGFQITALLVLLSFGVANASEFDRSLIEADWLRQAQSWRNLSNASTPTAQDALGAVDEVKDGKYGFHTAHAPNP